MSNELHVLRSFRIANAAVREIAPAYAEAMTIHRSYHYDGVGERLRELPAIVDLATGERAMAAIREIDCLGVIAHLGAVAYWAIRTAAQPSWYVPILAGSRLGALQETVEKATGRSAGFLRGLSDWPKDEAVAQAMADIRAIVARLEQEIEVLTEDDAKDVVLTGPELPHPADQVRKAVEENPQRFAEKTFGYHGEEGLPAVEAVRQGAGYCVGQRDGRLVPQLHGSRWDGWVKFWISPIGEVWMGEDAPLDDPWGDYVPQPWLSLLTGEERDNRPEAPAQPERANRPQSSRSKGPALGAHS